MDEMESVGVRLTLRGEGMAGLQAKGEGNSKKDL